SEAIRPRENLFVRFPRAPHVAFAKADVRNEMPRFHGSLGFFKLCEQFCDFGCEFFGAVELATLVVDDRANVFYARGSDRRAGRSSEFALGTSQGVKRRIKARQEPERIRFLNQSRAARVRKNV